MFSILTIKNKTYQNLYKSFNINIYLYFIYCKSISRRGWAYNISMFNWGEGCSQIMLRWLRQLLVILRSDHSVLKPGLLVLPRLSLLRVTRTIPGGTQESTGLCPVVLGRCAISFFGLYPESYVLNIFKNCEAFYQWIHIFHFYPQFKKILILLLYL